MADEPLILQENGYLSPDIHKVSLEEFERYFVQTIPDHNRRKELFFGYARLCTAIQSFQIKNFTHWIFGSFTSGKEFPGDIDVVTIVSAEELNNLPPFIQNMLPAPGSPFNRDSAKSIFHCDSLMLIVPPKSDTIKYTKYQNARAYWRGLCGFTRQEEPRGFLELTYGRGAEQ